MAKYYEDEKIIEAIKGLLNSPFAQGFGVDDNSLLSMYYHNGIKDALRLVADMVRGDVPDNLKIEAADMAQPKTGRWQQRGDYYYYCSECGSRHTKTDVLHCKYYPDCGARLNAKGDA